ncbi:hypothetical protein VNI00_003367 [Paramarasmius palmivorus]|uniref:Uncharacterized protein n=1 Tax=Paramarasmius palmivorus TaxID=297713 RepID=A0AAW0DSP1_9AGAR
MSLKIKLPSIKRNDPGMFEEPDTAQQRRRPSNKRAVITSDDEQDHGSPEASSPPPPKRQRLEEDVLPEHEDFDDIDIDIEATAEVEEDEDMEAFPVHTKASKRRIVKPKRFREEDEEDRPHVSKNPPPKKKRKSKAKKREHSDAETEDDFDPNAEDLMEDLGTLNDNEDDDFLDDEPKRSSKSKVPPRGKAGPSKGKGIEGTPGPSSSRKPRPRLNVDTDTFVDVGDSQSTSALPTATLRKCATFRHEGAITTAEEAEASYNQEEQDRYSVYRYTYCSDQTGGSFEDRYRSSIQDTEWCSKPSASTDLDLNNGNIYAELFKKGMQSSSNRREKDEQRRQELNKMRDDARAKRQAEAGETFALQAQMEKILRFEERLRRTGSPALYPNIMAAKMREVYDLDKRRRARETNREELEEGEMS